MNQRKFRKSPALEKMKKYLKEAHWRSETSIIAFRILYTLEERGMTQRDLAEKMGKSPQWINKIVKGQQNLTIGTMKELEGALGISLFQIPKYKEDVMTVPFDIGFQPFYGNKKQVGESKIIALHDRPHRDTKQNQKIYAQA